jgi:hypothetical protein
MGFGSVSRNYLATSVVKRRRCKTLSIVYSNNKKKTVNLYKYKAK